MEIFLPYLPDMEFAANPFDQPMIYAPYDALSKAIRSCPNPEYDLRNLWEMEPKSRQHLNFHNLAEEPTWEIGIQ